MDRRTALVLVASFLVACVGQCQPETGNDGVSKTNPRVAAASATDGKALEDEARRLHCGRGVDVDFDGALRRYAESCVAGLESSCDSAAALLTKDAAGWDVVTDTIRLRAARRLLLDGRVEASAPLLASIGDRTLVRFVEAGAALDAGDLEKARGLVDSLRTQQPADAAIGVLARLVDVRGRGGESNWLDALLAAWVAEGRPDLRSSRFLPVSAAMLDMAECHRPREHDRPAQLASVTDLIRYRGWALSEAFGGARPLPDPRVFAAAVELAKSADDLDLLYVRAALPALAGPDDLARAKVLQRAIATELGRRHPDAFHQLLTIDADVEKDVEVSTLDRLDAALATPLRPPFGPAFRAYRDGLERAGARDTAGVAFGAATEAALAIDEIDALKRALVRTANRPELRERALSTLEKLGRALYGSGTLVGEMIGSAHLAKVAELRDDAALAAETQALRASAKRRFDAKRLVPLQLEAWPLRSLQRELVEHAAEHESGQLDRILAALSAEQRQKGQ